MLRSVKTARPVGDPYLDSFHKAFEPELQEVVRQCCLSAGERILDTPCGNGFYTALIASQMTGGLLVAADQSEESLSDAARHVGPVSHGPKVEFHVADVYALPFDDGSFDFVWCAQSMISLDEPVAALHEIRRVLRPGGRVAVLETDEYHHIVLPWPVELELAIQKAVRRACRHNYADDTKFSQSRVLRAALEEAGFADVTKTTVSADRSAPFGLREHEFLAEHFAYLRRLVVPELPANHCETFERLVEPGRPESLTDSPTAELTVLASLHTAHT
jgi:ubiquinone/menaquinone biosynthesis C-methylase UbiE